MVPERKALLDTGGHPDSRQVILPEADHYFHEAGDSLTEALALWLNATDFSSLP
jgi:alpha/beta superfamily hydrolase